MYRVEEVPDSSAALTPGWTYAYVPDTGFDPAKAAITPALGRKRGVREPAGRGDLSSRQQTAIIRHLAELDRENHRDVPIPVKSKETAGRGRLRTVAGFLKVGKLADNALKIKRNANEIYAERPPDTRFAKDVPKLPRRRRSISCPAIHPTLHRLATNPNCTLLSPKTTTYPTRNKANQDRI